MQELRARVDACDVACWHEFRADWTLQRFLTARRFDVDKAFNMWLDSAKWRGERHLDSVLFCCGALVRWRCSCAQLSTRALGGAVSLSGDYAVCGCAAARVGRAGTAVVFLRSVCSCSVLCSLHWLALRLPALLRDGGVLLATPSGSNPHVMHARL